MVNNLPIEVAEGLKLPFGEIVNNIAKQISLGQLTAHYLDNLMREQGMNNIEGIKINILDISLPMSILS